MIPNEMMRGVFMRGNFSAEAASASAAVLAAYGIGIIPIVLIRSLVASFYARQDTKTPLIASFLGIAVNVALKLALYRDHGAVGLAFATAIGAWINGGLLAILALRRDWMRFDATLLRTMLGIAGATVLLALSTLWLAPTVAALVAPMPWLRHVTEISVLGFLGALIYGVALLGALKALGVALRRRAI